MTHCLRLRDAFCVAVLIAAAAPLAGCILPLVAGGGAAGYSLATEQRSPQQLARDAAIGATAHKYWAGASSDLARDVDATVYDNRLLITGIVPNQQMKDAAGDLARKVDGVKAIYNEVQIGQPTTLGQDARDDYVSTSLRTKLLTDPQVRSTNYTVHVLNGIVYIMGYARNAAERDRVLSYARNLANVARVVAFIKVGNEAPAAAPAAPANAPPAGQPPAGQAPITREGPPSPIEVTPLP